jgi:hypothetical protein
MMRAHREAILAIAGVLLFLPGWIIQYFVGSPDFSKVNGLSDALAIQQAHTAENWHLLLPMGLVAVFGTATIMVLLARKDLERVGDALPVALWLVPVYFLLQFGAGLLLAASAFVLIIPGLYVLARLWLVIAILPSNPSPGLSGSLKKSWQLTKGAGWKTLGLGMIIIIVGLILTIVIQIITGLILKIVTGGAGLAFLEAGFAAMAGTMLNLVMFAVTLALYRHLETQEA